MIEKRCSGCRKTKPVTSFDTETKEGITVPRSRCRHCVIAYAKRQKKVKKTQNRERRLSREWD